MVNPANIDQLVKTVTTWSQSIRNTANAIGSTAHDNFQNGSLAYADYNAITQQLIDVLQQCVAIDTNAASFVASLGTNEITAITAATKKLNDASANVANVQKIVTVVAELLAAAASIGAAVASPTAAAIAGAAAAVGTVASAIAASPAKPAGQGSG